MSDVTELLEAVAGGDPGAEDRLLPLVYGELRRLASRRLAREKPGQTLQATALVHEAWLRLGGGQGLPFQNRRHFFAAAAEAMRRVLVESARRKSAAKRGAGADRLEVDLLEIPSPAASDPRLLDLDEALGKFAALDPRRAELVKLRYFVGLTFEEAAEALGIAVPTAKQWWAYSRAWLSVELRRAEAGERTYLSPTDDASASR